MNRIAIDNGHRLVLIGLAAGVLVFLGLSGCGGATTEPEVQLRAWVESGQEAAEAKQRRDLLSMISPAYADGRSNTRDDIGDILRVIFLRQSKVKLATAIDEIRVFGGSAAEIDLTVAMAELSPGILGLNADAYRFSLELELDDDEWQLISARWGKLGGELR